ncbi:MAG: hypothetical protein JNM43_20090 [Planctomycetaceae bacterium]|nr:hypothetical protein [Planctomycetaceae bacterium]
MRLLMVAVSCFSLTGCKNMFHELRPHRLWRWNYSDAPSQNALFSVPDRLDADFVNSIDQTKAAERPVNHE